MNTITRIGNYIKSFRPKGVVESALEITPASIEEVLAHIGRSNEDLVHMGDFLLCYDDDMLALSTRERFFERFRFTESQHPEFLSRVTHVI